MLWLLLLALVGLIWYRIYQAQNAPALYCLRCGTVAQPKSTTPGSMLAELILYLFLIIPGLLYSAWRLSARRNACPACGASDLIPPDSPRAKQIADAGL